MRNDDIAKRIPLKCDLWNANMARNNESCIKMKNITYRFMIVIIHEHDKMYTCMSICLQMNQKWSICCIFSRPCIKILTYPYFSTQSVVPNLNITHRFSNKCFTIANNIITGIFYG